MDETEEIKQRIDIVDFVSTYLTLKKAGANYKAICPFHQEKTPSFMVSPEKQIWHCFGCGLGGDIFTFLMKMENLEFPEALRLLAERAGVQLKRRSFKPEEGRDRKTKLYQINDLSAKVFHKILIDHPAGRPAREYLKKRRITLEIIKDFLIGYAPSAKFLEDFLIKKGFSSSEIQEAGSPNRFFRRIMFPIKDAMGNTIAFTGRVLDPKQEPAYAKATADRPKYLNTGDTIIFHKGRVLYNLHQAKGTIKQENATIIVEGQMDVVASWQAGIKNVVASSGTALTPEHLQILYRYTPNIIFAFDSDIAGLATAKKAYEMAIKEGFNVKMVILGEFKDPGEMIAKEPPAGKTGTQLWQEAVKNAISVIDWYFELAFNKQLNNGSTEQLTSQQKKEIAREILPIIKIIPDSIEQAHYVNLLAKRLGIAEEVVFSALARVGAKRVTPALKSTKKTLSPEQLLLGIIILHPEKFAKFKEKIMEKDFRDAKQAKIYKIFLKEYNSNRKELLESLRKELSREEGAFLDSLILEVENLYRDEQGELDEDLRQLINHLKQDKKEALKSYYATEIQKAEGAKDYSKLKKLIKEFQEAISK